MSDPAKHAIHKELRKCRKALSKAKLKSLGNNRRIVTEPLKVLFDLVSVPTLLVSEFPSDKEQLDELLEIFVQIRTELEKPEPNFAYLVSLRKKTFDLLPKLSNPLRGYAPQTEEASSSRLNLIYPAIAAENRADVIWFIGGLFLSMVFFSFAWPNGVGIPFLIGILSFAFFGICISERKLSEVFISQAFEVPAETPGMAETKSAIANEIACTSTFLEKIIGFFIPIKPLKNELSRCKKAIKTWEISGLDPITKAIKRHFLRTIYAVGKATTFRNKAHVEWSKIEVARRLLLQLKVEFEKPDTDPTKLMSIKRQLLDTIAEFSYPQIKESKKSAILSKKQRRLLKISSIESSPAASLLILILASSFFYLLLYYISHANGLIALPPVEVGFESGEYYLLFPALGLLPPLAALLLLIYEKTALVKHRAFEYFGESEADKD